MEIYLIGLVHHIAYLDAFARETDAFHKSCDAIRILHEILDGLQEKGNSGQAPQIEKKASEKVLQAEQQVNAWIERQSDSETEDKNLRSREIMAELKQFFDNQMEEWGGEPPDEETAHRTLKNITIRVKAFYQPYFLAWMQDFICELVEPVYRHICTGIPSNKYEQSLVVVVLPEFIFRLNNHPERVFDAEPAKMFLENTLPQEIERHEGMQLRTLSGLSLGKPVDMLIFAGTIIWKERRDVSPSIFYNSAPVFWQGRCCFIWDKQLIALGDGVKVQHSHAITAVRDPIQGGPQRQGWNYQSPLSQMITRRRPEVYPVFTIYQFTKPLTFGLSVCMDYESPNILSGGDMNINMNDEIDIHVLLSQGMGPKLECIRAKKLFIACDGIHRLVFMASAADKELWKSPMTVTAVDWSLADKAVWNERLVAREIEGCMENKPILFVCKEEIEI